MPRFSVPDHVLTEELDGTLVLLNLHDDQYYSVDAVGTRMWRLLTAQVDTDATVARLVAEYDVEESALRRDLADFVARLSAAGLLVSHG